jgi:TolA-binding protein
MFSDLLECVMIRPLLLTAVCIGLLAPSPSLAQEKVNDPALGPYYAGNAAYNRKLYPIAVGKYEEFLAKYSTHKKAPLARFGLGLSYFADKKYAKAMPHFQMLLEVPKLDPKIAKGQLTLLHAQCLLYTNKKDEAQSRLIAAASNLPAGVHRTGAIAAVVDLFFAKKEWAKTVIWAKKLEGVKADTPQLIRAGYQQGFALYKLEKYPAAIAVLGKTKDLANLAKAEAWTTRISYLLSECHVSSKKLDNAEASLQAALAGLRGQPAIDAQYRLGIIKFSQQKWAESQADFSIFLQKNKIPEAKDPRVREARLQIARCMMEQGEAGKAAKKFTELITGTDTVAARAVLWHGRLYSRNTKLANRYGTAAGALRAATDKEWYKKGFLPKGKTTIIADIDFEYANALMLQNGPDWKLALQFLQRVQSLQADYKQMAEVRSQQAICQHKLKQFTPSSQTTTQFIAAYEKHPLINDMRFLHAENLFLLNRFDEATTAYNAFLAAGKGHDKTVAAQFRIAQIFHHQQKWAESNKLAVPLLDKKPEGMLFSQLSFVVGENYFRLGEWAKAVSPFEAFLETYLKRPKNNPKAKPKLTMGPNVDTALIQLGIAYVRLDKKEDAVEWLRLIVGTYPITNQHMPLALSEQGKLYYELEKLGPARAALVRFVTEWARKEDKLYKKATAEVGRVHYYLGWIDSTEKKYAEAAKNFGVAAAYSGGRKSKSGSPLAADAVLQQGIALVNAKDFKTAAPHLQKVINQYKEHARIDLLLYYTGLAYARLEQWPQAATFFKRVLEEHPKAKFADKAAYEWAWCDRSRKDKTGATTRYELLLAKYPTSNLVIKVQSELAELNLDAGAQDAVIAKLTETLAAVTDPKLKFELQYQLASAHFKKKDYENSAKMFEALIPDGAKSKLLSSILFQAGESRLALTETAPARDHYLAGTKVGAPPALAESILLRLGETQNITGQHKESQANYTKFLQHYKESKWVRNAQYGKAYAIEKQEKYAPAIGEYNQLIIQDPKKPLKMDKWMVKARYQIGECYFNLNQLDKATAEFVSVDANSQGYPDWQAKAVLEMGRILLVQNKKPDALARMKEVIKRFPKTKAAVVAQKYLDQLRTSG